MSIDTAAVRAGYRWCFDLARSHYENFPVASRLLPAALREPVVAVYAFARTADDIADEGVLPAAQRLQRLDDMAAALQAIDAQQTPATPLFAALADSIARYGLPLQPFHELLDAFRQDVNKRRYASFGEVIAYCRLSANPVGRLLLHLSGNNSPRHVALSDAVCSALQLINFLQDIDKDFHERDRIYLPADDMTRFGVTEAQIADGVSSPGLRALVHLQAQRAAQLLRAGSPLANVLRGRLALELRAIVLGGSRILTKLREQEDVFSRPRLTSGDRIAIAWAIVVRAFQ